MSSKLRRLHESSVVCILVQVIEQVDSGGCLGLHVCITALIEVKRVALQVALSCQVERLTPEAVSLAVWMSENVLVATDSIEHVLTCFFRHFDFFIFNYLPVARLDNYQLVNYNLGGIGAKNKEVVQSNDVNLNIH